MEERIIPGASKYTISEDGAVRSFADKRRPSHCGMMLKPQFNRGREYLQLRLLMDSGKMKTCYIHQLVAASFIGLRQRGCDIDHIDGDKLNNHVSNLRYVTRKENMMNPNNKGRNAWQKLGSRKVVARKDGQEFLFDNLSMACRELGLPLGNASCQIRGVKKNCGMRRGKPHLVTIRSVGGYVLEWAS